MGLIKRITGSLELAAFVVRGRKPHTLGYQACKEGVIKEVLLDGKIDLVDLPEGYGVGFDERVVEYPWFFHRLPAGPGKLLDAGSVLNFEYIIEQRAISEKRLFISTLAPERNCFHKKGVSYVYEDLRELGYRDAYFDWVVSLSTVEHIGMDNTMFYTGDGSKMENRPVAHLAAIREMSRVLKPGGILYLSVPFGRRENHGWLQVFDAGMVDRLIETFSPSSFNETHFRYGATGWKRSSREGSSDAKYFDVHGSRDYDADRTAAAQAVVCLELQKGR